MEIDRSSPIPVYVQIEQMFERLIFQKDLGPNELLPSVPVLAEQLKVSSLTVQKAYRRLVERGLIYSIVGKGTFVAEPGEQEFVALLVHNFMLMDSSRTPTLPLVLQGIREQLEEARLPSQILTDSYSRFASPPVISPEVMDVLRRRRPMGIVLLSHGGSQELLDLAEARSIPVIGFERAATGANALIRWDKDGLLRTAVERLRACGVREAGVIWLDMGNSPQVQLSELHKTESALRQGGLATRSEWIVGAHEATSWAGYHAMNYLWDMPQHPDGLVILDDVLGQGAAMAMMSRRIAPPELRVVVQGNEGSPLQFDPSWMCCEFSPALAARTVVAELRRQLSGGRSDRGEIFLPFKWRAAEAAGAMAAENWTVPQSIGRKLLFRSGKELVAHSRRRGAVVHT